MLAIDSSQLAPGGWIRSVFYQVEAIANFAELVKFGKLATFGDPQVYKNLHLNSDVM